MKAGKVKPGHYKAGSESGIKGHPMNLLSPVLDQREVTLIQMVALHLLRQGHLPRSCSGAGQFLSWPLGTF